MAQIKIYGHRAFLTNARQDISDSIHECSVKVLGLPEEKKFHRFIPLEKEHFVHPEDRSEQYLIIEVSLIAGRTRETKKAYIRKLFTTLSQRLNISTQDIEITLFENPKENWGIRGLPADELTLNYKIEK